MKLKVTLIKNRLVDKTELASMAKKNFEVLDVSRQYKSFKSLDFCAQFQEEVE